MIENLILAAAFWIICSCSIAFQGNAFKKIVAAVWAANQSLN